MMDTTKFAGIIAGGGNGGGNFYDMGFYRKLGEGSNMSVDSIQTSVGGGSVENSSVSSRVSQTGILHHSGLRQTAATGSSIGHSIFRPGRVTHPLNHDALAQTLMDPSCTIQGLDNYDEWTLDLRQLSLGEPFVQGVFGKLYRGVIQWQISCWSGRRMTPREGN